MKSTSMTNPKRIFIDTSAWIEYILTGERYHKKVNDYIFSETKEGSKFFTSDYVLDEAFTRFSTGQSFQTATKFKNKVHEAEKQRNLLILWMDEVLFNKSWSLFEKFSEHKLSFTDATIVVMIRNLKIDEVLTLDQGFRKIGLTIKPVLR